MEGGREARGSALNDSGSATLMISDAHRPESRRQTDAPEASASVTCGSGLVQSEWGETTGRILQLVSGESE